MKQIGIFGGTFDPPHLGHFIIADEVKHQVGLDEIWFIPTNVPPHKNKAMTSNEHRLNMIKKGIDSVDYFKVNSIELERKGTSFTIDTVNKLVSQYQNYQFHFIIGADMVEYLPHWKQIEDLQKKVQFIGVNRPDYQLKTNYSIKVVQIPFIEISSTKIRERITKGMAYQYFMPAEVYAYMKEHQLYESK